MDTKHSSTADGGKSNPTRLTQRQREKRINLVESSDGGVEMLDDSSVASNNTAETDNAAEGDAAETANATATAGSIQQEGQSQANPTRPYASSSSMRRGHHQFQPQQERQQPKTSGAGVAMHFSTDSEDNTTMSSALEWTASAEGIVEVSPANARSHSHEALLLKPNGSSSDCNGTTGLAATGVIHDDGDDDHDGGDGQHNSQSPASLNSNPRPSDGIGGNKTNARDDDNRSKTDSSARQQDAAGTAAAADEDSDLEYSVASVPISASTSAEAAAPTASNATAPVSEWDKALMAGKASTGRASSDLFQRTIQDEATKDPDRQERLNIADGIGDREFFSQAERQIISEAPKAVGKPYDYEDKESVNAKNHHKQQQQQQQRSEQYGGSSASSSTTTSSGSSTGISSSTTTSTTSRSFMATSKVPPNHQHARQQNQQQQQQKKQNSSAAGIKSGGTVATGQQQNHHQRPTHQHHHNHNDHQNQNLSSGMLPDVLMTMRQKIESLTLFDSDMMRMAADQVAEDSDDPMLQESYRESLKRSSQQSLSASTLVTLSHKRYERRRLSAMEIEKIVRGLVQESAAQGQDKNTNAMERVRAILLLLSDDYVRSENDDARKGGVLALASCAIGLNKANDQDPIVSECRDLILASVVHACQDHSGRVRYYAIESLFNVVKTVPVLAVQHFFILFEILRSLYGDLNVDVRTGAELLNKKLKEVIVVAMNSGNFTAEACVPVFARFVYVRNKATKRLTLDWLQELNEKLIGAPILEFLHLFLGGIFDMIADPTPEIRQSALAFLQSVLPKLLVVNSEGGDQQKKNAPSSSDAAAHQFAIDDMKDGDFGGMKVDFDKILQSLVATMEHPDPFVRKVAMYWMSRIVKSHMREKITATTNSGENSATTGATRGSKSKNILASTRQAGKRTQFTKSDESKQEQKDDQQTYLSAASISVRHSLPHVLPGILLSIGDSYSNRNSRSDSFLPDQTTRGLAEQTNATLQDAVRRDGQAYVQHLDRFIIALQEELDSQGPARLPAAIDRATYRNDVKNDGTSIESRGWFRGPVANDAGNKYRDDDDSITMPRLCALHWVIVLYESVVPDELKADYAREFIYAIIHQLVDNPPETIVYKSLEVLAKITIPVTGEDPVSRTHSSTSIHHSGHAISFQPQFPMTDVNVSFALGILEPARQEFKSRDREVFSALIQLHSYNEQLLADLSRVITYMCKLQPPEFVLVSFAVELDRFILRRQKTANKQTNGRIMRDQETKISSNEEISAAENDAAFVTFSHDLKFVSSFVRHMGHVLLNTAECRTLREALKDCIGISSNEYNNANNVAASTNTTDLRDKQRARLFHILLHSFSHNLVAATSLSLWVGAYRTASIFLNRINPLDIDLMFLLEMDTLVEMLERPLFRHLHVRMLECNGDTCNKEQSGAMLFLALKAILMLLPQSTCYRVLKERLDSTARFRQSAIGPPSSTHVGANKNGTRGMPWSSPSRSNKGQSSQVTLTRKSIIHKASTTSAAPNSAVGDETFINVYVKRVLQVRALHCAATWRTIRSESLERKEAFNNTSDKRVGNMEETALVRTKRLQKAKDRTRKDGGTGNYEDLTSLATTAEEENSHTETKTIPPMTAEPKVDAKWKTYWASTSID